MNEAKEEKQRCQYELWVNEYFGLPENFPERATCTDFDYGQLVNMLAMFDEKRNEFHRRNLSDAMHERDLENASLRDQLSKEREINSELTKRIETDWYVVALRQDIEKERKMRKELVEELQLILNVFRDDMLKVDVKHYESLITKATELDKNQ